MAYYIRTKNIFNPKDKEQFKVSRSKIDLFLNCPKCFYLDRKLGIPRPDMPGFTLNIAVDALLKKEFDIHRSQNQKHPLMKIYKVNAVPFAHAKLNEWRHNFTGIQYYYEPTNFLIFGAIDDLWINPQGELIIVDYKATSTQSPIDLDSEYKQPYKRQMEIYQWLFRKNGFPVSQTGYFVYCNGLSDKKAFDAKLEFDIQLIPYKGSYDWVEPALRQMKECLIADLPPEASQNCDYCCYRNSANKYN
ncbi:MAG: PD-(D/E)XK nuclease family protein [bacterium]|nr:PD-(D/E)XK nuclease family protein [bacterium]